MYAYFATLSVFGDLWHALLGYPSNSVMTTLFGHKPKLNKNYSISLRAKQTKDAFPLSLSTTFAPFDLIHLTFRGPYNVLSTCGSKYFLTIFDNNSRSVWIYFLTEKREVANTLKKFLVMIHTHFHKMVQSDNGTEFMCLKNYFKDKGIVYQTTITGTPQKNGRVECKHHHILNMAHALHFHVKLPIRFWGECVLTVGYLINRTSSIVLKGRNSI